MSATQLQEKKLLQTVRQSVREAVANEFAKLRSSLVPYISAREQRDIETRYRKPTRKTTKSFSLAA